MKKIISIFTLCLVTSPTASMAQSIGEISQLAPSQNTQESRPSNCTEPFRNARVKRPFDIESAYPPFALNRDIQGTLDAVIYVKSDGKIGEIQLLDVTPPGVFDSHSMEEIGNMQFEPARLNCQSVGGFYRLSVNFMLY